MNLFHVTLSSALPSILTEGLVPRTGPRSERLGEPVPAVYCFGDRAAVEDGLTGWMADAFEDEALVILEIEVDCLVIERHPADFEYRILERISPARILAVFDEAWGEIPTEHSRQAGRSNAIGRLRS